ncbi:MAG: hypothetical protein R2784_06585 [Saprospiraceae bacterium]
MHRFNQLPFSNVYFDRNIGFRTAGFWAVFITNASEQFGTNLRATAACTIPSLVRTSPFWIGIGFTYFAFEKVFGNPLDGSSLLD